MQQNSKKNTKKSCYRTAGKHKKILQNCRKTQKSYAVELQENEKNYAIELQETEKHCYTIELQGKCKKKYAIELQGERKKVKTCGIPVVTSGRAGLTLSTHECF